MVVVEETSKRVQDVFDWNVDASNQMRKLPKFSEHLVIYSISIYSSFCCKMRNREETMP